MCFGRGFPFVMLAFWATVVVVVAALTTWWVLFALAPLAMMASMAAMMGVIARSVRNDPSARPWGWCARALNAWLVATDDESSSRTRDVARASASELRSDPY